MTLARWWQRHVFETSHAMGPQWAAVTSGYAVVICGKLYLTPDGERYLDEIGHE